MDLERLWAEIQRLNGLVKRALASALASGAALAGVTSIQSGTVQLGPGTGTATVSANITSNTRIVACFKASSGGDGGAEPFTTRLECTARANGTPGSFQIAALTNAGVADTTNVSSVDWIAIN
jgi:hypothetical protein